MENEQEIIEQLKFHLESTKKLTAELSARLGIPYDQVLEMIIRETEK